MSYFSLKTPVIESATAKNGITLTGTATIGHTDDTDLLTFADGVLTVAGEISVTTLDIGGTNVSATAAELNYNDTGAAVGTVVASKTVTVDANKDVGTIRNLTIDGVFTDGNYTFDTSGNVSGLGTVGCGAITSTGNSSMGQLTVDNIIINGTTIGHTDDADLLTFADGVLTVAGEISVTTLDIGGTNVSATAAELNYNDTGAAVGTVVASKTVTVDANKDVGTIRNLTIDGVFTDGNYTFDTSGNVSGLGTVGCGAITSSAPSTFSAGILVKNGATGPGYIEFYEDSDHGGHKITLAPVVSNLSGDITVRLPSTTGVLLTAGANEYTDTQTFNCDLVLSVTAKETNTTTDSSEAIGSITTPVLLLNQYAASGTPTQTYTVGDGDAAGQILHIFFSTTASTRKIRLDFQQSSTNYLLSGSGSARYLTFDTSGQSATLIYTAALTNGSVAKAWRIINTGATVSS